VEKKVAMELHKIIETGKVDQPAKGDELQKEVIAFDLDGTLIGQAEVADIIPELRNHDLIKRLLERLRRAEVHIATNQGGIPVGKRSVEAAVERIKRGIELLESYGIPVQSVQVSVFNPRATPEAIRNAYIKLVQALREAIPKAKVMVYDQPQYRKPGTGMLEAIKATHYFGDSPEDMQVAQALKIGFEHVPRLVEPVSGNPKR
jgi:histidinol phosphatase-like enzyme